MASFSEVETAYLYFPERVQSLMLSTTTADGAPHASYAPFIMERDRTFYIFVSGLSSHTQNLKATGKAGILLIEDEAQASQIFARQRLMYDCTVTLIARNDPQWTTWGDKFAVRFGNLITMLRQLPDFQMFQLKPQAGRFVVGFGAAYAVDSSNLDRLMPTEK
ncbi:MAG: pyridoxamine 5'-phosphate oxidase family protein [Cyanobacteria bacterium J06626_18]